MRRLVCLGVALAAFLAMTPSVSGEPRPMKSSEWGKIASSLEPYFKEKDWKRRDGALLRRADSVAADLDAKRLKSKKGSCLADVAGIRRAVYKAQSYVRAMRKGFRPITWNDSPFPLKSPKFYISVPKNYRPAVPTPLILALHPLGMDAETYGIQALLRSKVIKDGYFIVAPVWPDRAKATWGTETVEGQGHLLVPVHYALRKFFIDPERIYVVGEAEGATAALDLAMSFGDRFAGVFAVGEGKKRALVDNLKGQAVHRLKGADARPHLPAYDEMLGKVEGEEVLRRNLFPKTIDWRFAEPGQEMAWWMLVLRERKREEDAGPGRIQAEIKEGNVIAVTTEGVDLFRLYVNDEMLNLDDEIKVVINGTQQAPWKPERKVGPAVEWMMDTGDLGRIFLASRQFDVPIEKKKDDGENGD